MIIIIIFLHNIKFSGVIYIVIRRQHLKSCLNIVIAKAKGDESDASRKVKQQLKVFGKMADVMDVHVLDSTKNMNSDVKQISGIPQDVFKLLINIGVDTCDNPRWSVRISGSQIYLDMAWDKSPANTRGSHVSDTASKDIHTRPKSEARRGKKRKSPSSKRRDRQRLEKWRASKRRDSPTCPLPGAQPVQLESHMHGSQVALDHSHPTVVSDNLPETVQSESVETSVDSIKDNVKSSPVTVVASSAPQPPQSVPEPSTTTCKSVSNSHKLPSASSYDQELYNRIFNTTDKSNEDTTDSESDSDDPGLMFGKPKERCFNFRCTTTEKKAPDGLKKCTRCRIAQYCCRRCQAEHWHIHKTACKDLATGALHL